MSRVHTKSRRSLHLKILIQTFKVFKIKCHPSVARSFDLLEWMIKKSKIQDKQFSISMVSASVAHFQSF